jgi:hypothetical protein
MLKFKINVFADMVPLDEEEKAYISNLHKSGSLPREGIKDSPSKISADATSNVYVPLAKKLDNNFSFQNPFATYIPSPFRFNFAYAGIKSRLIEITHTDYQIMKLYLEHQALSDKLLINYIKVNYEKIKIDTLPYTIVYKKLTLKEIKEILDKKGKENINDLTLTSIWITKLNRLVHLSQDAIISYKTEMLSFDIEKQIFDFAVYNFHTFINTYKDIFSLTTFIKDKKWVLNKKWFKNNDLPKFIQQDTQIITVPGYTIENKYKICDNSFLVKSKILYHKYDFIKEIENISNSIECIKNELDLIKLSMEYKNTLLEYINSIDYYTKRINLYQEKLNEIINGITSSSFENNLIMHNYNLPMFILKGLSFNKANDLHEIYKYLCWVKLTLLNINLKRGYVLTTDIFDSNEYPIISSLMKQFISIENYNKLNNYEKVSCYKWMINIILLNFYTICNKALWNLSTVTSSSLDQEETLLELISQFKVLSNWSHSMLDNSIKQHMIKRNLTIYSDVVCGFDTEYVCIDWGKNELLSAQISLSHVLKLKIPIFENYKFEGVNTLTSENYMKALPKFDNVNLIIDYITENIKLNRTYKFNDHDKILNKIINHFGKEATAFSNVCLTNKSLNVLLYKTPIKNIFIIPKENEKLELNYHSLIKIIQQNIEKVRLNREILLFDYIKNLNYESNEEILNLSNDISRFTSSWDANTMKNEEIITKILSNKENLELSKNKDEIEIEDNSFNKNMLSNNVQKFTLNLNSSTSPSPSPSPDALSLSGSLSIVPSQKGELGGMKNLKSTIVPININRKIYLVSHYNAADLTMLKDWKSVSLRNVDIAKKCFTTLTKPIKYDGQEKVYIRDTILLASAAARNLGAIAYSYKLEKIDVSQHYKENMDLLFKENYEKFKLYAMNDSLITLIHTLFINDFAFKLGSLGIPNTLGTLSSKYIKNKWLQDNYRGYQIDVNYPIGDVRQSHTPKGIQFGKGTIEYSNLFIGAYRGGRNECFKYGIDKSKKWFDYDLVSCYSTIMGMMGQPDYEKTEAERLAIVSENLLGLCGQPDYNKGMWIHPNSDLSKLNIKESYTALKIKFCLPKEISYPPFPVTLDNSITVYPSSGETLVTGLEYITGISMLNTTIDRLKLNPKEYFIEILYGAYIPFKKDFIEGEEGKLEEIPAYSPFYAVIEELQLNRRLWRKKTGKGSAMERIYKDLGNMLYGKIVCGISNKKVYDARSLNMKSMIGNDLSNPILGSWITGFVRSLIAEMLFKVDYLGGEVVSCTTDGFVTDIENLEEKLIEYDNKYHPDSLLNDYRNIRLKLSGEASALEIKTSVKGIIQWTTRGQLSLDETGIPITAATGYQKAKDHRENVNLVKTALVNGNKILFLQKELTGALDCYNSNKQVSMTSQQRSFRTIFDSKRHVINSTQSMLNTKPFNDITEALLHRKLMMELKTSVYSDEYSLFVIKPSNNCIDETVKFFIRMLCHMYNNQIPKAIKFGVASILNNIDKSIKTENILDLISAYQTDPGNIVTTLPKFKINSTFVLNLFNKLLSLKSHDEYCKIINVFKIYFDNFNLPLTEEELLEIEKQEVVKLIQSIPASKLTIQKTASKISIFINTTT